MKLSLILMTYNTSHLLARTLQTLRQQALDDWELIVIDDNSEDDVEGTLRRIAGYRNSAFVQREDGLHKRAARCLNAPHIADA